MRSSMGVVASCHGAPSTSPAAGAAPLGPAVPSSASAESGREEPLSPKTLLAREGRRLGDQVRIGGGTMGDSSVIPTASAANMLCKSQPRAGG
jgi:hypothetical protein